MHSKWKRRNNCLHVVNTSICHHLVSTHASTLLKSEYGVQQGHWGGMCIAWTLAAAFACFWPKLLICFVEAEEEAQGEMQEALHMPWLL